MSDEDEKLLPGEVGNRCAAGPHPDYTPELKTLKDVERIFQHEFHLKKDWASIIAHACFVGNMDRIYQAFSKALLKGDPKVFQALANRAYGLPQQELAFSQEKPFKLVIEYIGEDSKKKPVIDGELKEDAAGDR